MPATSNEALQRKRSYIKEWKKKNREKVATQKRRAREREAFPKIPRRRQWKSNTSNPCRSPNKNVSPDTQVKVSDVDVGLTTNALSMDEFNPDEILNGLFSLTSTERKECDSSAASQTFEGLEEEMVVDCEDPVQCRLQEIKQHRKQAENTRCERMIKDRKELDMISETTTEVNETLAMMNDMSKWFAGFEREDTVDRASQFEYSRTIEITSELMCELEEYLFS